MHALGIDTSCYTTSVAIVNEKFEVVTQARRLLKVKAGKRGLSQSEMLYQHVRNLPELIMQLRQEYAGKIDVIGVSAVPRRREDSYMPAFLAGLGTAHSLASVLRVPLYRFSHQETHVFAAIRDYPELWQEPLYMLHLSGGTTDWLEVKWQTEGLAIAELATSDDISAGQLIDRIGVMLGLPFPAGPSLERLAQQGKLSYRLSLPRRLDSLSFAGAETQLRKVYEKGDLSKQDLAVSVFDYICRILARTAKRLNFEQGRPFIAVGGVFANMYLRNEFSEILRNLHLQPFLAAPEYSSDNATGNAFAAVRYQLCAFKQ